MKKMLSISQQMEVVQQWSMQVPGRMEYAQKLLESGDLPGFAKEARNASVLLEAAASKLRALSQAARSESALTESSSGYAPRN